MSDFINSGIVKDAIVAEYIKLLENQIALLRADAERLARTLALIHSGKDIELVSSVINKHGELIKQLDGGE